MNLNPISLQTHLQKIKWTKQQRIIHPSSFIPHPSKNPSSFLKRLRQDSNLRHSVPKTGVLIPLNYEAKAIFDLRFLICDF
jgi:hypothetical protein